MRSFLLPVAMGLLAACGSDGSGKGAAPAPQKIYADYSVNFRKAPQFLEVAASFHSNLPDGDNLSLSSPAQISVNGEPMTQVTEDMISLDQKGVYYRQRKSVAEPQPSYTFVWTRQDGRQFAQTIDVYGAEPERPVPGEIQSRGKDLYVLIKGQDLAAGEGVICQLTSQQNGPRDEIVSSIRRVEGERACVFSAAELARFPVGAADLVLIRFGRKEHSVEEASYSAKISYTYESSKTTITIQE